MYFLVTKQKRFNKQTLYTSLKYQNNCILQAMARTNIQNIQKSSSCDRTRYWINLSILHANTCFSYYTYFSFN